MSRETKRELHATLQKKLGDDHSRLDRTRLSNTDYSNDVVLGISTGGGIHKQVPNLVGLGPEFELIIRSFDSFQGIVKNFLD